MSAQAVSDGSYLTKKRTRGVKPQGTKPGDVIHVFNGGTIQMLTDVVIDPAGDIWAANNWNNIDILLSDPPAYPTSTWGGGSGFTVIYGIAAPVKTPLMGQVRAS